VLHSNSLEFFFRSMQLCQVFQSKALAEILMQEIPQSPKVSPPPLYLCSMRRLLLESWDASASFMASVSEANDWACFLFSS